MKCVLSVNFKRFSFVNLKEKFKVNRLKRDCIFKCIFVILYCVGMEASCRHFHARALGLVATSQKNASRTKWRPQQVI